MRYISWIIGITMTLCLYTVPTLAAAPADNEVKNKPIPPFSEVQQTVLRHFEKIPDYRPGDLITQKEVGPLLKQLQKQGLPLDDAKQILEKTPVQDEFLARILSTPNGRRFMRRIAALPDGYDRVDRLSRIPQGRETVRMLVGDPHGERMIEYMTTAKGGIELGRMLSQDPGGANFNRPTGRLYTVSLLLDRLEQSRKDAVKAAKKSGNR